MLRRKPFATAKTLEKRSASGVDMLKWKCSNSQRKHNERSRLHELVLALAGQESMVKWTTLPLVTFARVSAGQRCSSGYTYTPSDSSL